MTEIKCPNCGSENIEPVENEGGKLCTDCICLWNESKRKPANTWIRCSERMPESHKYVLIFSPSGGFCIAWLGHGVWQVYKSSLLFSIKEITHWQPLPQPPVAGKDGE